VGWTDENTDGMTFDRYVLVIQRKMFI